MVTAIPSLNETGLNSSESGDLDRLNEIVIRIGPRGIRSTQILADDSATEERLCDMLKAIRPQLESASETMASLQRESVEVRN